MKITKIRYLIEPRDRIYLKAYRFLSFAKNVSKSLSNKYVQKILDNAEESTTDVIITASKRAIQKTAEVTGDLIGNKVADKVTSLSKKPAKKLPNHEIKEEEKEDAEITIHKKTHISPDKKQQNIDELSLVPKKYV